MRPRPLGILKVAEQLLLLRRRETVFRHDRKRQPLAQLDLHKEEIDGGAEIQAESRKNALSVFFELAVGADLNATHERSVALADPIVNTM